MSDDTSLLLLALGEAEVPAFLAIAERLRAAGVACHVATWLPRLAQGGVRCLADDAAPASPERLQKVTRALDLAHPSMAADYDRDWHFAGVDEKTAHAARVLGALDRVFADIRPTHLVSSVGGETCRMVAEALAIHEGTTRWYFNALPLPQRFVLLPSLSSPFLAYEPDGRPLPAALYTETPERDRAAAAPSALELVAEGARRGAELAVQRPRVYPRSWLAARSFKVARQRILQRLPETPSTPVSEEETVVLYPLHDERDFQVAVRERHAIPQAAFLTYIASTLPPGYRLWVKPHPEHSADHHPLLWRRLRLRPNVTFAPASLPASEAIRAADVILTLASSLGFEAIDVGKPVVCYGSPFYSQRGLTHDVSDPREVARTVVEARGTVPDPELTAALRDRMLRESWPGQFTPLSLTGATFESLSRSVLEALSAAPPPASNTSTDG